MTHDTDEAYDCRDSPGRGQARAAGTAPPALDPLRRIALVVVLVAGFMDLLDRTCKVSASL